MTALPLPDEHASFQDQKEVILLAMAVWGEARGESDDGMRAVACVVRNRVNLRRPHYGTGWRGVILKRWQFSCFNPGDPNRERLLQPLRHSAPQVWARCLNAAEYAMSKQPDVTHGATHYFTRIPFRRKPLPGWDWSDRYDTWAPKWWTKMTFTVEIGRHLFWRES